MPDPYVDTFAGPFVVLIGVVVVALVALALERWTRGKR